MSLSQVSRVLVLSQGRHRCVPLLVWPCLCMRLGSQAGFMSPPILDSQGYSFSLQGHCSKLKPCPGSLPGAPHSHCLAYRLYTDFFKGRLQSKFLMLWRNLKGRDAPPHCQDTGLPVRFSGEVELFFFVSLLYPLVTKKLSSTMQGKPLSAHWYISFLSLWQNM